MMQRFQHIAMAIALGTTMTAAHADSGVPRYDHVVIAIMENHDFNQIIGNADAPYINALAAYGANFTQAFAVTHPSQPNYLALFSGSTQGVTTDTCLKHLLGAASLGSQLLAAGLTFVGYSEDLPLAGSTVCTSGAYARKHNPWSDFSSVPAASNQPFAAFPSDYTTLPTLAFVVPNLNDDMHDGTVAQGDAWLQTHLDGYVQWAATHNSLFVVTWDENDGSTDGNHIDTLFAGAGLVSGDYAEITGHYRLLATLEAMYGLAPLGEAATLAPITDVWDDIFVDGFDR
jgi:hypothetical protein